MAVGIGKASPNTALDIYHTVTGTIANSNQNFGLRLSNSSGGGIIQGGDIHHSIFFRVGRDNAQDTMSFHEFGKIRFYTGGLLEAQTERMTILSNGSVGIGTIAPATTFEVIDDISSQFDIILGSNFFRTYNANINYKKCIVTLDNSVGNQIFISFI